MKKILLFIFTLFSLSYIFGQGNNLQFNQVIFQEFNTTAGYDSYFYSAGTITVPSNKVWKITSTGVNAHSGTANEREMDGKIMIGNHKCSSFPIWLNSGTYPIYLSTNNITFNYIDGSISGVEFNIVQ